MTAMVMLRTTLKQEQKQANEHWHENENDTDDLLLSFLFPSDVEPWEQKAKDMLDLTMTAVIMLRVMLKLEQKPESIGMRTLMTTMTSYCQFFSFQWCGTMGTESQGYVGFDDDCTGDVEELEQKPERFKTRSKMTLMAWIKIMIFFFSFCFSPVVWNPWEQKAKEMADFDDDGWQHMLCVEAGKVSSRVVLPPGDQFECSQTFKVVAQ